MSEDKETRRNSKKVSPGIAATVNRLETSKAVLNALRNTAGGSVEWLSFLRDAAGSATGILASIQAIEDGEIDENFVALGLDSCGLVYIVISRCQEESETDGEAFDQMKVQSGELTRVLHEIHEFVEKKAHRNLYKRVWKHSADGLKISGYRDQLRKFMEKFGTPTDSSIHDMLEEIIDEKLRRHEQKERNSKSPTPRKNPEVAPIIENPPPPPPPKAFLAPPKTPNDELLKPPPPSIVISTEANDELLGITMTSDLQPQRQVVKDHQREDEEMERQKIEAEAKKKKRLEDERARKRAEKERWRKSEQSFIQLPESAPDADNRPSPAAPEKPPPLLTKKPSVITIESDSESEPDISTVRASPKVVRNVQSQFEDERVAAALHAKMQRELEEEDEIAAQLEALKLQRQWDAEERKNSRTARPKKKKTRRSPTRSSSARESPSPEVHPMALPLEVLEGLRREARRGGSEGSPRYHSQSPKPETGPSRTHTPDSMMPPYRSDVQYNAYPQLPNPYDPNYYPGPHLPPPSMAMHNIAGSAISLGGGPVSNQNSGNTHTTNIINSMNDHSVTYYGAEDDSE